LSALDAKVRVRLRGEIKDLQRRLGVTTIMVTHDQEEALTMADRIVVMDHGVIEQVGTPEEIYGVPATAFVADFIGTMNFLDGTVETQDTVKVGNAVLHCETDGMPAGTSITVAIRPEDINAQDISEDDNNIVDVEIMHMEFLGSFYRVGIGGPVIGGQEIRADFSINLVRRKNIEVGSKLPLRFPTEFIRIYRGATARASEP
jgi:iron(III) transport system ATP-binding protein